MKAQHRDRHPLHRPVTALLAMAAVALGGQSAQAQRVGGSIGVSLTVLPPVATQAVQVTGFRVGRNGTASLRTTAPTTAQVSQVVMTRISSSSNGFVPVSQAPALVRSGGAAVAAERELTYRVEVGASAGGDAPRDVRLHIEYVTVAGT